MFGFGKKEEEGLVQDVSVYYYGGHPDYKKKKTGEKITLKLFEDRFELTPTLVSRDWFKGVTIPYSDTVEVTFPTTDKSDRNDRININYKDKSDQTLIIDLQVIKIFGSMEVLHEINKNLSILKVGDKFNTSQNSSAQIQSGMSEGIPEQIEKLAGLLEKGFITQDDFNEKKSELLGKM